MESCFFELGSKLEPIKLRSGEQLSEVTLAYEVYGELNADRDNAILVFHALTGSQHAAGFNPSVPGVGALWTDECQSGWWDEFIGPGRALDTDRFASLPLPPPSWRKSAIPSPSECGSLCQLIGPVLAALRPSSGHCDR